MCLAWKWSKNSVKRREHADKNMGRFLLEKVLTETGKGRGAFPHKVTVALLGGFNGALKHSWQIMSHGSPVKDDIISFRASVGLEFDLPPL